MMDNLFTVKDTHTHMYNTVLLYTDNNGKFIGREMACSTCGKSRYEGVAKPRTEERITSEIAAYMKGLNDVYQNKNEKDNNCY